VALSVREFHPANLIYIDALAGLGPQVHLLLHAGGTYQDYGAQFSGEFP
jgi:hypothetical protein